jgi:hypothetical protein
MDTKRMHVVLGERLIKDIDRLVGPRRRSSFLTEAAEEKLMPGKTRTIPSSDKGPRSGSGRCARRASSALRSPN